MASWGSKKYPIKRKLFQLLGDQLENIIQMSIQRIRITKKNSKKSLPHGKKSIVQDFYRSKKTVFCSLWVRQNVSHGFKLLTHLKQCFSIYFWFFNFYLRCHLEIFCFHNVNAKSNYCKKKIKKKQRKTKHITMEKRKHEVFLYARNVLISPYQTQLWALKRKRNEKSIRILFINI